MRRTDRRTATVVPAHGTTARRICIVTTAVICDNPRVVKEADALAEAGHSVRVVSFAPRTADVALRNDATMQGRRWRLETVRTSPGGTLATLRWGLMSVLQRVARWLVGRGVGNVLVADLAISKHARSLLSRALTEPADLVIAHHAAALPAASRAAKALSARLAFDAEDLHAGELPDRPEFALERRIITLAESRYLPQCDRITASAPGIAEELANRYRIVRPVTILNVFPSTDELPAANVPAEDATVSLYWFSQVIGLDRGLQDVLRAMALTRRRTELHLRGALSPDVSETLVQLARSLGVESRLHFHQVAPPPELIALAAEHDIGLALEQPTTLNHRLCMANKLFLYYSAGIPVIATDIPGQRAVISASEGAGRLYPAGDPDALAREIDALSAPEVLAAAKMKARALGRSKFSWEHEGQRLVAYLMHDEVAAAPDMTSLTSVG